MKCDLNCGRNVYFFDEASGTGVCEICWRIFFAPFEFKPKSE